MPRFREISGTEAFPEIPDFPQGSFDGFTGIRFVPLGRTPIQMGGHRSGVLCRPGIAGFGCRPTIYATFLDGDKNVVAEVPVSGNTDRKEWRTVYRAYSNVDLTSVTHVRLATIHAVAEGYQMKKVNLTYPYENMVIRMRRGGRVVNGQVVDPDGKPIPNVLDQTGTLFGLPTDSHNGRRRTISTSPRSPAHLPLPSKRRHWMPKNPFH